MKLTVFQIVAAEPAMKALSEADEFTAEESFRVAIWLSRIDQIGIAAKKAQLKLAKEHGATQQDGQWKVPDALVNDFLVDLRETSIDVDIPVLDPTLVEKSKMSPGVKSLLIPFLKLA